MSNPWNLTDKQCQMLALLVAHGNAKRVALALNSPHKSTCNMLRRCFKKIGAQTDVQAALMWDRWAREAA